MIIPMNARITTKAKTTLYVFRSASNASNVATIMTSIVRNIGVIPRIPRWICTSRAEIFAIVATEIRPRYKLKGTWTKSLSFHVQSFFPSWTLLAKTIKTIRNANIINTDTNTCWKCRAKIRPILVAQDSKNRIPIFLMIPREFFLKISIICRITNPNNVK